MYRTLVKKDRIEIVREYKPVKRNITVNYIDYDLDDEEIITISTYFLQFPTMLFMKSTNDLHVAFCKTPIKSLNDRIYCPTIGNIYYGWRVCGCNAKNFSLAISQFWTKSFTEEGDCGPNALYYTFKTYKNWEKIKTVMGVTKKLKTSHYMSMTFKKFLLIGGCLDSFKIDLNSEYKEVLKLKDLKCYPQI